MIRRVEVLTRQVARGKYLLDELGVLDHSVEVVQRAGDVGLDRIPERCDVAPKRPGLAGAVVVVVVVVVVRVMVAPALRLEHPGDIRPVVADGSVLEEVLDGGVGRRDVDCQAAVVHDDGGGAADGGAAVAAPLSEEGEERVVRVQGGRKCGGLGRRVEHNRDAGAVADDGERREVAVEHVRVLDHVGLVVQVCVVGLGRHVGVERVVPENEWYFTTHNQQI